MEITPLHEWIRDKTGFREDNMHKDLACYQLKMLKSTLAYARKNSPFYRRRMEGVDVSGFKSIADIQKIPFTLPGDIADFSMQMLCVPQGDIKRVITLSTSGTTARPKRIFFTGKDLELTADFFAHGMKAMVRSGQKVLVLMPGPNPGSVGERLARGLERIGCLTFVHGFVNEDTGKVAEGIKKLGIDCLVGLPVQVLSIVRRYGNIFAGRIKSVLLSGDYVPNSIIEAIEDAWKCPVFTHYGLTETGLGAAVECQALMGCHIREGDLYLEIVDDHGNAVPDGCSGEIVITTLTRTGMPLIRYRTGDISRIITQPCPCGSGLKRLDRIQGRSVYALEKGELRLDQMDEAVFQLEEIIDYEVSLGLAGGVHLMNIEFWAVPRARGKGNCPEPLIRRKLMEIPSIGQALDGGVLILNRIRPSSKKLFSNPIKRRIKRAEYAGEY